jgi:hypothetical protein
MTAFLGFVYLTSPVCTFSLLKTPVKGQADSLRGTARKIFFSETLKRLIQ